MRVQKCVLVIGLIIRYNVKKEKEKDILDECIYKTQYFYSVTPVLLSVQTICIGIRPIKCMSRDDNMTKLSKQNIFRNPLVYCLVILVEYEC